MKFILFVGIFVLITIGCVLLGVIISACTTDPHTKLKWTHEASIAVIIFLIFVLSMQIIMNIGG